MQTGLAAGYTHSCMYCMYCMSVVSLIHYCTHIILYWPLDLRPCGLLYPATVINLVSRTVTTYIQYITCRMYTQHNGQ